MAKSTSASNLFSDFKPPKIDKKVEEVKEEIVEKKEEKTIEEPTVQQDIQALVQEEVSRIVSSQNIGAGAAKIGRPKKYDGISKVISVRLDNELYEFARRKGRLEYDGLTDYVSHLIKEDKENSK